MVKSFLSGDARRVAEMLALKGWLETRWRLMNVCAWAAFFMALNYQGRYQPQTARSVLVLMWLVLTCGVLTLAGSGVKSQSSIGFPEGLAESTQFTLALPVSRALLVAVRAGVGLVETLAVTVVIGSMTWGLFPSVSGSMAPTDFLRLGLTTLLWLALPYCAALLFEALLVEPLSSMCAGWTLTLLLWLLHRVTPAVDVISAFGSASPLLTHRLPWSQLATSSAIALMLLVGAVWIVHRREY